MYDLTVFIGRFQIFHNGHLGVVKEALKKSKYLNIIIGSANEPRSIDNPFTADERSIMILSSLNPDEKDRVSISYIENNRYNDTLWVESIQREVYRTAREHFDIAGDPSIALIGHSKDKSSYYLKLFPQWDSIEVANTTNLSSTNLRHSYFSNIGHLWLKNCDGHNVGDLKQDQLVPSPVKEFLEQFYNSVGYNYVCDFIDFIDKYKRQFAGQYQPYFITTDIVLEQSSHILLIKRKAFPGKGQWALPGGFLGYDEYSVDSAIRELVEETKINVPKKVLVGNIKGREIFEDPNRSARGRTVTIAYHIKLPNDLKLPKVKGGDDAEEAKFFELDKIDRSMMFEDHMDIILAMVAKNGK